MREGRRPAQMLRTVGGQTGVVYHFIRMVKWTSGRGKDAKHSTLYTGSLGNESQSPTSTHRLHVGRWDKAALAVRLTLRLDFPPAANDQLSTD